MASSSSNASNNGEKQNEGELQGPILPLEIQVQIMESYVAKNYDLIYVRTPADLRSAVDGLIAATKDAQNRDGTMLEWNVDKLDWIADTAILSSATIKMDIASRSQAHGPGTAHTVALIPPTMAEISGRVQHLALYISEPFSDERRVDGGKYLRATAGMASLGQQLPHLKSLTFYLCIDVSVMSDGVARSDIWWTTPCTDGSLVAPGSTAPLTGKNIQTLVNELLAAVKDHGPGEMKLFKLSVEHDPSRRRDPYLPGYAPSISDTWKLVCDDIDLLEEDVIPVTRRAWDSRKFRAL